MKNLTKLSAILCAVATIFSVNTMQAENISQADIDALAEHINSVYVDNTKSLSSSLSDVQKKAVKLDLFTTRTLQKQTTMDDSLIEAYYNILSALTRHNAIVEGSLIKMAQEIEQLQKKSAK